MKTVQVDNHELQLDQMKFIVFKEDDKMFFANESEGFYKNDCTVLEEPKVYCIKRTPENANVLNKWANRKDPKKIENFYKADDYFMCSEKINYNQLTTIDNNVPEGFTELFTVEEFFEKVRYNPEKVVEEPVKEESGNYVGMVEEENAEHEQLLDQADVAFSVAGFKFERKDLDIIVSMQELVYEFGGKLDIDTITKVKFEINERYKIVESDEQRNI